MVESALLLAVGYVLTMVKFKVIPQGGSVTLASMLPIVLLAYRYGPVWGFLVGGIHGLLQMMEGGLAVPPTTNFINYLLVILLDYILAWAMVGLLSGLVMKQMKNPRTAVTVGALVGIFGRFLCSFLSGMIIWGVYAPEGQSVALYSFLANGMVLFPEMIITAFVGFTFFSFSAIRNLFDSPTYSS